MPAYTPPHPVASHRGCRKTCKNWNDRRSDVLGAGLGYSHPVGRSLIAGNADKNRACSLVDGFGDDLAPAERTEPKMVGFRAATSRFSVRGIRK